jgi:hypothetical protein
MSWADLAYRGLVVRPWDVPKPKCAYRHSPFRSTLSTTLNLLAREIRMLNGKQIVVMLDIRERDIRLDGLPRADARIGEPCVALSFESKWGPVRMVTGEYRTWQDNLRAISLSLEALRSVDRYGVSKSGEQYRGWRALPVSTDGAALLTTSDEAVDFLSQWFVDPERRPRRGAPQGDDGDASRPRRRLRRVPEGPQVPRPAPRGGSPMTDVERRSVAFAAVPGVELTSTSLIVRDPNFAWESFETLLVRVGEFHSSVKWYLGDLLNHGEALYGERYTQAVDRTGLSVEYLMKLAYTCRAVARSRRREGLRFSHHEEVAALDRARADRMARGRGNEPLVGPRTPRARPRGEKAEAGRAAEVERESSDARKVVGAGRRAGGEAERGKRSRRGCPTRHPLWENSAQQHARDVVALAATAKVSLRDAASRLIRESQNQNGDGGEWRLVPRDAFDELVAALAAEDE